MAEVQELNATARPRAGKGAARQARREAKVPAVIYGNKDAPQTINLDYNDLWKLLLKGRFTQTVFDIVLDGQKHRVLPRDVQLDPVKDFPIHVDFHRIGSDGRVRINVPIKFFNEALSPGLKRGGVLNIVRRDVEVTCPADAIPATFEIDLEGLDIGRSIHISAVTLPPGVTPTIQGRDFTLATIAGAVKEEAAAEAAPGTAPAAGAAASAAADGKAAAPAAGAKGAAPAGAKGAAPAAAKGGDKKK